ncbi:MAG TPA: hypothetical protein VNJ08_09385 [Bacteriovoracaceae bacterium]|nr:hypothetical protein [Bacteriovoracaceae bacterium]
MKTFLFIFFISGMAWGEMAPITRPYPTEESMEPIPGMTPPESSPFEQAVDGAAPITPETTTTEVARPEETPVAAENKATNAKKTSGENRKESNGTVMVGYQLITTWIPSKKTISYTHIFNKKWSLEGEYAWSTLDVPFVGVDLGAISEKRFSLMAQYYPGNSFYFSFGPYFNDFEAQVGSDILNNVSGTRTTSSFGVEGIGLTTGMGNRWQWDNGFTLGMDWIRLNVPLIVTDVDSQILTAVTNKEDDKDIRKVIQRFNRIPTFVLFGLNIGYTF